MVRKFIILAIAATLNFASNVVNIANGLLGSESSKVASLFGDGRDFLDENGNADIAKISNLLKSKSLLTLSYKNQANLDIVFISEQKSPLLMIKILKDALSRLGYNEILTTEFANADSAIWGIRLNTKFMLDPGSLYAALKETNTFIEGIERTSEFSYKYLIDISKSSLNLTPVEIGKKIELSKPLEPYFIDINGASKVSISAQAGDSWFALVRILDKNLNLIDEKRNSKKTNKINLAIPKNAKYITIDDLNSLENIKRGLKIYLQ